MKSLEIFHGQEIQTLQKLVNRDPQLDNMHKVCDFKTLILNVMSSSNFSSQSSVSYVEEEAE